MDNEKYEYNSLEHDTIWIKKEYKKKGKEYGIVELDKKLLTILVQSIELMSVSPNISTKFSEKVEKFVIPRYTEINDIIYAKENMPTTFKVEISKENQKEFLDAFELPNVKVGLEKEANFLRDLSKRFKKVDFYKLK